ncbi:MAG: phosphoheptose isomerase, partial [Verrucomicrobia bacterium]|nr:phosphoheptose isomerase [Verrucomicrobiota bacterium]
MPLEMSHAQTRRELFAEVKALIQGKGLRIQALDLERPWGGFFAIDETQASEFTRRFFPELAADALREHGRISPKILM